MSLEGADLSLPRAFNRKLIPDKMIRSLPFRAVTNPPIKDKTFLCTLEEKSLPFCSIDNGHNSCLVNFLLAPVKYIDH